MDVDWTSKEVESGQAAVRRCAGGRQPFATDVRSLMTTIVRLFLSRASWQVKEDVERVRAGLDWGRVPDGHCVTGDESREALSRLAALAQEAEALRVKVSGLENENVEAKDHATLWRKERDRLIKDYDSARSEVERLKAELRSETKTKTDMAQRAAVAESRLAAVRERSGDGVGIANAVDRDSKQAAEYEVVHTESSAVLAGIRWVLDGGTPAATLRVVSGGTPEELKALEAMGVQVPQEEKKLTRDVGTGSLATDDPAQEVAKFASVNRVAALAQEAGAKNGREVAAFHAGHKAGVAEGLAQVRHVAEMPESDPSDDGEPNEAEWQAASDLQAAHDRGAEAMRVALLREAKAACDQHGAGWLYQHLERRFKGAIP